MNLRPTKERRWTINHTTKGFKYRHTTSRFERNTESRIVVMILILAGASFLTLQMSKHAGTFAVPDKGKARRGEGLED